MSESDCWTCASAHASDIPTNAWDQIVSAVFLDNANQTISNSQPINDDVRGSDARTMMRRGQRNTRPTNERNNTPGSWYSLRHKWCHRIKWLLSGTSDVRGSCERQWWMKAQQNARFFWKRPPKGSLGESGYWGSKTTPFLLLFDLSWVWIDRTCLFLRYVYVACSKQSSSSK